MIDFSSEAEVTNLYKENKIGPYVAVWILNKKFKKGYKKIADSTQINKKIIDDIKNLSKTIYKSNIFSRNIKAFLTTNFTGIDERLIKKLIAIAHSPYLVQIIDYKKTTDGISIFVKYNNDKIEMLLDTTNSIDLPSFEVSIFKLLIEHKHGMEEVLSELNPSVLNEIKEKCSVRDKKEEVLLENHIEKILSAFNFD